MQIVTSVLAVTVRNTRTGKTVYDVACGDGAKRQCWDAAVANALNAQTGQVVTLDVEQKQNGQWLNENIQGFMPGGAQGQLAQTQQIQVQQAQPTTLTPGALAIQPSPSTGGAQGGYTPEVVARITKLACIDTAAILVAGIFSGAGPEALPEALSAVQFVSRQFYKDARSHEGATQSGALTTSAQPQTQIVPTATTPQEIAQQVPGVVVGAPVVPTVAQAQDAAAESGDVQWD